MKKCFLFLFCASFFLLSACSWESEIVGKYLISSISTNYAKISYDELVMYGADGDYIEFKKSGETELVLFGSNTFAQPAFSDLTLSINGTTHSFKKEGNDLTLEMGNLSMIFIEENCSQWKNIKGE